MESEVWNLLSHSINYVQPLPCPPIFLPSHLPDSKERALVACRCSPLTQEISRACLPVQSPKKTNIHVVHALAGGDSEMRACDTSMISPSSQGSQAVAGRCVCRWKICLTPSMAMSKFFKDRLTWVFFLAPHTLAACP